MKKIELVFEKFLKEGLSSEFGQPDNYVLEGSRQLYEASGNRIYLDYFMQSMENIVSEDGSISMWRQEQNAGNRKIQNTGMERGLFWMYDQSGKEKYKKAIEKQIVSVKELCKESYKGSGKPLDGRQLYLTQPFYMEYETKYHNKAEYKDIVRLLAFGGQKYEDIAKPAVLWQQENAVMEDAGWYLMALVDVIGCMSIEIYEHYRFLEENLKRNIRWFVQDRDSLPEGGENDFGIMLGYVILKACNQKNLNPEKYGDAGQKLVRDRMDSLDFVKRKETVGLYMMACAQFLRFKGGHMPA